MDKEFSVVFKTRNINSRRLLTEIKAIAEDAANEYIVRRTSLLERTYNYEQLVTFFDLFLADLVNKQIITHFDMISDHRINNPIDVKDGKIKLHVKFRQLYCLNISEILMEFRAN